MYRKFCICTDLRDTPQEDTDVFAPTLSLQRTKTGIISNRRPVCGTSASGTTTPKDVISSSTSGSSTPRLSLMAAARQEAARRTLYSMFSRGPVLGAEVGEETMTVDVEVGVGSEAEGAGSHPRLEHVVAGMYKIKSDGSPSGEVEVQVSMAQLQRKRKCRQGKEVAVLRDLEDVEDGTSREVADFATERRHRKAEKRSRKTEEDDTRAEMSSGQDVRHPENVEKQRLKAKKRARNEERLRLKEERRAAEMKRADKLQDVRPTNMDVEPKFDIPSGRTHAKSQNRRTSRDKDQVLKKKCKRDCTAS